MRILYQAFFQLFVLATSTRVEEEELGGCWKSMKEAGWTKDDTAAAIREMEEEGNSSTFHEELRKRVVADSAKCCLSYNKHLYYFTHPANPRAATTAVNTREDNKKTAVFVLGPSAVGKTSMAATLAAVRGDDLGIRFPLVTLDGSDWRTTSKVWRKFAQIGGAWQVKNGERRWITAAWTRPDEQQCRLSDFYDTVFKKVVPPMLENFVFDMLKKEYFPTVIVPETAAKCALPGSKCRATKVKERLEELGYTVKFLVIHGDPEVVQASGTRRALEEGKLYDSRSYGFALASVKYLHATYPKHDWRFYVNSFREDEGPLEKTWEAYSTELLWPTLLRSIPGSEVARKVSGAGVGVVRKLSGAGASLARRVRG
mmetsp:Transcript_5994/g.17167  ORF Transcript_5994/g.17167 Transcript_5994/m.17167 type:complete len:371 (+) Transcript_5994:65-1177(+)